jgi:hypothetical protein
MSWKRGDTVKRLCISSPLRLPFVDAGPGALDFGSRLKGLPAVRRWTEVPEIDPALGAFGVRRRRRNARFSPLLQFNPRLSRSLSEENRLLVRLMRKKLFFR